MIGKHSPLGQQDCRCGNARQSHNCLALTGHQQKAGDGIWKAGWQSCTCMTELGGLLCAGACLPSNKRPRQSELNQAPQLRDVFPVWLEASPQER